MQRNPNQYTEMSSLHEQESQDSDSKWTSEKGSTSEQLASSSDSNLQTTLQESFGNLNPNWQVFNHLKIKAKQLARSNRQMRAELEDIGDPLLKNCHQLTDYLRQKEKTTKFVNEDTRKAYKKILFKHPE